MTSVYEIEFQYYVHDIIPAKTRFSTSRSNQNKELVEKRDDTFAKVRAILQNITELSGSHFFCFTRPKKSAWVFFLGCTKPVVFDDQLRLLEDLEKEFVVTNFHVDVDYNTQENPNGFFRATYRFKDKLEN